VEKTFAYCTTATWTEHRRGIVEGEGIPRTINFAAPPEFEGEPGLWTPEHLLVAAVATCFTTTFRKIAELSQLKLVSLQVTAEGRLEKGESGFRFTRILIRPVVTLGTGQEPDRALRLLHKAEQACLVTRSLTSQTVLEPMVMEGSLTEAV
jgi:peroxiredoxin-like protein